MTGNESDAALVITTLVLAAGFAPMKSGLEHLVARRYVGNLTPAAAAEPAPASSSPSAAELEALMRRVVREELASALAETPPTRATGPASPPDGASR
jgi:hypothetical protein